MPVPAPPQLEAALAQLVASLEKVEGRKVDVVTEPWPSIEKGVIKLLGGPFEVRQGDHQVIALGLAAAFGERLAKDLGAFWFPNRETVEGASLGFPEAIITLQPFGAVVDALRSAKLEKLDDLLKDIRGSLGQVKFAGGGAGAARLRAEDYMRLFDPGFVQLVSLDDAKTKQAWNLAPERLSADLRDAIGRAQKLPADVKKQLEQQLVGALSKLPSGKPVLDAAPMAPRVVETMGLLFGATLSTGSAPEEFWNEVVFPLLFIGAPATFPPLDEEEVAAAKQGIDPLFLFLDVVPYAHKAPEEGLMGAFAPESLSLPDPKFQGAPALRLMTVGVDGVKAALEAFDPAKTKDALKRFGEHLKTKTGDVKVLNANEAAQMVDAALILLEDLKKVVGQGKTLCLRRLTEGEAASEPALVLVRGALQGPRIILAP